jgi:uncharacterized membrane protein YhaH (DUF805 family)
MNSLALFFSSHGRIGRKPFALAIALVYVLIFASQLLLSTGVTARANVVPFALLQGLLTFAWYALHAKRLRDAGRGTGAATALAVLYAMSVVLFLLLVELVIGVSAGGSGGKPGGEFAALLFVLFLVAMFSGDPSFGLFFYLATVLLVLIFLPLVIAMGFSLWAGTRTPASP